MTTTTIVPKSAAIALALYSGLAIILQNGTNATLHIRGIPNPFATAAVSYGVGFVTITIISLMDRPPKFFSRREEEEVEISILTAPWYAFLGGPLGAVYVCSAILLSPRLGFCMFQLCVTFGQLTSSMICDAAGFLHLKKTPTTPWRVLCLVLLALGTGLSGNWSGAETDDDPDVYNSMPIWRELVYATCAMCSGSCFPVQSCVNFAMIPHVGTPYRAVAVSFAGGLLAVCFATLSCYLFSETTRAQGPVFSHSQGVSLWLWLGGGVLGASFITAAVLGLPSLGAVAFTGIFISTQLVVATIFDSFGAFGFTQVSILIGGGRRIVGVVFAVVAAAAFQIKPPVLQKWPCAPVEVVAVEETTPLVPEEEGEEDIHASYDSVRQAWG